MAKKEHPIAMDIPAQIENLKSNNLLFEDEEFALQTLQRISYYRLIKAYGIQFKDKDTGIYKDGTTFENIYRVYEFDVQLRQLLMPYLHDIEIAFRCQIANHFCVKYGVLGYLDSSNFDSLQSYESLENKMQKCLAQSSESPIIRNFRRITLMERFLFMQLSKYLHLEPLHFFIEP